MTNKWPILVVFFLMVMIDASTVRHHHHHCPSCRLNNNHMIIAAAEEQQQQEPAVDSARIESIKRQILVKLGLSAKPNVSAIPPRDFILETLLRAEESVLVDQHHRPQTEADLFTATTSSDSSGSPVLEDDFYGKTSEIIAFAEPGPRLNGQVLAEFSRLTQPEMQMSIEPSLRVKAATLWLYVQLLGKHPNTNLRPPTLYVFRVQNHHHHRHNITGWTNELLVSQRVTLQHSGWMKLNLTEGVQKWFSTSSSSSTGNTRKLRLLVDCSGCGSGNVEPLLFGNSHDDIMLMNGNNDERKRKRKRRQQPLPGNIIEEDDMIHHQERHRPFLVVHTDSSNARRLRRRTPLDCGPATRQCCKQRFFVSFKALGWDDWIIAPSGYYANYCRGDCGSGPSGSGPRTPDTFLNYHTHVLEEFRKIPSTAATEAASNNNLILHHQPCCAPTKFSSMSLIYFGADMNIIKRDLPKMVVDECGCP